jgi:hypothetical protein
MKGTLTKTEQGWVVNYNYSVNNNDWCTILLHPTDVKTCNNYGDYSVDWDGKEVDFDMVTEWETGEVGVNGLSYAKLITPNKLDLNKIESKIDEALANETPEKLLGWMWKDIEKEDSMNFICQDPDCPHCIEEINQMQDDDLEDDVEKLSIKLWKASDDRTGNPPYIYSLGVEHGYNNAKESLYTEEQVRKAYEYGSNASLGISKTNLIQSLKK